MSIPSHTSAVISALRFPLSLLVVFVHASLCIVPEVQPAGMPLSSALSFFVSDVLAALAVPAFFLISGYLFFHKVEAYHPALYAQKLKKRATSLLQPYVAWNVVYLILIAAIQFLLPQLMSGNNKAVADYSLADFLLCFVSMDYVNAGFSLAPFTLGPIDLPLWYVRDLLLLALFSPLWYWCLTRLKLLFLALLFALWMQCGVVQLLCIPVSSILFFCMGGFLSLRGLDLVEQVAPLGKWFLALFLGLAVALFLLMPDGAMLIDAASLPSSVRMLKNASLLVGVGAVLYLGHLAVGRWRVRVPQLLGQSGFFLYACHFYFVIAAMRVAGKVLAGHDLLMAVAYLLVPLAISAAIISAFALLRKWAPSLLAILTGGR